MMKRNDQPEDSSFELWYFIFGKLTFVNNNIMSMKLSQTKTYFYDNNFTTDEYSSSQDIRNTKI